MKILVTGANGLIGKALCVALGKTESKVIRAVRMATEPGEVQVGELSEGTSWGEVLCQDIDVVVHLAGQVTFSNSAAENISDRLIQVNASGTASLAHQCIQYGVKRFIFISTVKVLGEGKDEVYRDCDRAVPEGAYAISKWEAEKRLLDIAKNTNMEVVILRVPLVYGPGVKGNFLSLMQAIDKSWPLPFGSIKNRRSLIYLGNLVDAICLCVNHPKAAGRAFFVSDGDDVSTPELVCRIAAALGRYPFLLPFPISWMRGMGRVFGKQAVIDRLIGSLVVDIEPFLNELDWSPPYNMYEGLEVTVKWYHATKVRV